MAAGRKNKRGKIEALNTFPNVFQCPDFNAGFLKNNLQEEVNFKGKWKDIYFKNKQPLVLELACGKGDYTIALARKEATKNFIGVDIKGPRLHLGAKIALEENLQNVAFARIKIENICTFFDQSEVDEMWITFPDPFPKDKHEKHRLTHTKFLEKYKEILKPQALVNFKMDDLDLFHYTKQSVENFGGKIVYYKEDIYAEKLDFDFLEIKTFYEKSHIANGRKINFMQFTL